MTEPFFRGMENGYKSLLAGFLRVRWMAWVIIAICASMIYWIGTSLQSELAPLEDRSSIRFQMSGPEGASYGYMVETGDKLLNYLTDSVPEKDFVFAAVPGFGGSGGVNGGTLRIKLVEPDQRNRSQSDIAKAIGKNCPASIMLEYFL